MSTFTIPLSGLTATAQSLNAIANNLANLNTDGYKDETLDFSSVFNQMQGTSGNGDPIQQGNGVQVAGTATNFASGNVNSTGVSSNMALQGNGFFVVKDSNGVDYTRNGDFTVNSQGELCTQGGQLVMGYPAVNGVVQTGAALAPITVDQANNIPAVATTSFQMTTNLDATAAVGATYSSPITVYDSLGESHDLTINYTNTAPNTWTYSITLPAADTGGTGNPTQIANGTLNFNSSGVLTSPSGTVTGIKISGLADEAATMNLTWNLNGSGGTPAITQQAAASATSETTQNGYTTGTLTGYSVLSDGTVQGQFSNQQTLALGQVAVASFANNQGLTQTADNNYQASFASGAAVVGEAGEGGNGAITGSAVEDSNVSLSTEFSNLIVAQQGYEANAKVLTTLDQVYQSTLQVIS
jgi:flagellar hook protein FlgE